MSLLQSKNIKGHGPGVVEVGFDDLRGLIENNSAFINEVLSLRLDRITLLKNSTGLRDEPWKVYYLQPIYALCKYILTVPARRTHFYDRGGLFKLCIDMGFFVFRSADASSIFSKEVDADIKREMEPRWRYAAFLSGLLYPLGMVAKELKITSTGNDKIIWNPLVNSLHDWCLENNVNQYSVQWNIEGLETNYSYYSTILAQRILNEECLQILARENILDVLFKTLSENPEVKAHKLSVLTYDTFSKVIENEKKGASFLTGLSIEYYIIDNLRKLVKSQWKINNPDYPVFCFKQGVFINWAKAGREVINIMSTTFSESIPSDLDTLADILLENGYIEAYEEDDVRSTYWPVIGKNTNTAMAVLRMLKLKNPNLLFNSSIYTPIEAVVGKDVYQRLNPETVKTNTEIVNVVDKSKFHTDLNEISINSQNNMAHDKDEKAELTQITESNPSTTANGKNVNVIESDTNTYDVVSDQEKRDKCSHILRKYKDCGILLDSIGKDLHSGVLKPGIDVVWDMSGLCIRYPGVISKYGSDAKIVHQKLSEMGWLDIRRSENSKGLDDGIRKLDAGGKTHRYIVIVESVGKNVEGVFGKTIPFKQGT